MNRAELEKKPLSELHKLAADAGVERFRMLSRTELVAKLADGDGDGGSGGDAEPAERSAGTTRAEGERPARRRRSRGGRGRGSGGRAASEGEGGRGGSDREPRQPRQPRQRREPKPELAPESEPEPKEEPTPAPRPAAPAPASESSSRPRRRRRRRFGRRGKQGVTLQGLLLPPAGRQALLAAESREACTALLRGIAADLSTESDGLDPVALLIDPSPEELAEWRRDAPQAEIVAAGQPRHADDALAQAKARASAGDHVILLVDSLTRLGEAHDDADAAKEFFDAAGGNLTVVAAVERPRPSGRVYLL